jgi:hypothetical protein
MGWHHIRRRMAVVAGLALALVGALAAAGRSLLNGTGDPGPPPITTMPATKDPGLGSRCASGRGVPIGTGDDAQRVMNAHRAGTTYLIKAGTHQRNFSVQRSRAMPSAGSRARCWTAAGACRRHSPAAPPT